MVSPSSSSSNGAIRLGGLTSGFDTQSIITQLLAPDQARIDQLTEEQEVNQAKIDTWNDISEQLKTFAESVTKLRADGTTGNTLFDDKVVSSSTETVATASATSSAIAGEYNINITQQARAHVAYGDQKASNYTLPSSGTIILNGESIALTAGDSLQDIANKITASSYLTGEEVQATVIDDRLVIQTKNTGASSVLYGTTSGAPPFNNGVDDPNSILETELGLIDGGGDLANVSQTPADASFTVNGIAITRSSNTITDVIDNVTFNLLADSGSTKLTVAVNTEEIKEAVTEFVDLFNETRDLIERTRNAKLDENDEFGLMFSDALLRELFNEVRSLTTSGVRMGGEDWDGTVQLTAGAAQGDKLISVNGFTAATGTLNAGDSFTISGDNTIYTLQNSAVIAGNAAVLEVNPPLSQAAVLGDSIDVVIRTTEDFGMGVRTDTVSGIEGILGIVDEGKLDSILSSDVNLIKQIFTRNDNSSGSTGVARRLYDWIDKQTKISVISSTQRSIDDIKIPGIEDSNERISDQIERLQERMLIKEESLVRQFAEMENALSRAQSSGAAVAGLGGGGG